MNRVSLYACMRHRLPLPLYRSNYSSGVPYSCSRLLHTRLQCRGDSRPTGYGTEHNQQTGGRKTLQTYGKQNNISDDLVVLVNGQCGLQL